jgi:hypothetical protein
MAQTSKRIFAPNDFDPKKLQSEFGANKKLIPGYELPLLIALAHYPELKHTKISFHFRKNSAAAFTTFKLLSALGARRHYVIIFNDDPSTTGIVWKEATLNAQIGLAGHELGHIAEFQNMSNMGVIWWGVRYLLSKKKHRELERATDQATIDHGLGWQLFDWNNFAITSLLTSEKYRRVKRAFYLSPEEIEEQLR